MSDTAVPLTGTAAAHGLARCHDCSLLSRAPVLASGTAHCPRCHAELHLRKPASLHRTWALLIAAYIMYIPANVLPVSTIVSFGQSEDDTILSGVIALFQMGDPEVALLLAFASIAVPLLKLFMMTWLALSVQFGWDARPRDLTVVYRIVEAIGRWSMLDIFVISLLAALVRLDSLATIQAGPGAVAFCAVVVLTMFAALSFDPRLMWDHLAQAPPPEEEQA